MLWYFTAARGAQEKTFAELKGEFALELVPTNHYGANSAWRQPLDPCPQLAPQLSVAFGLGHPQAALSQTHLCLSDREYEDAPLALHQPRCSPCSNLGPQSRSLRA